MRDFIVIGIGGGGDVASTVLARDRIGFKKSLSGSLLWDSYDETRRPTPWRLEEVIGLQRVSKFFGFVKANCRVRGGFRLNAMRFAECFDEKVAVMDIFGGYTGLLDSLKKAIKKLRIKAVYGLDVGGDVLVHPSDKVISPLADSLLLAVLSSIPGSKIFVTGLSLDGELEFDIVYNRVREAKDALIDVYEPSKQGIKLLGRAVRCVKTNSSKNLYNALMGNLKVPPEATKVYVFDASRLIKYAPVARELIGVSSFEDAESTIRRLDLRPESDILREKLRFFK